MLWNSILSLLFRKIFRDWETAEFPRCRTPARNTLRLLVLYAVTQLKSITTLVVAGDGSPV